MGRIERSSSRKRTLEELLLVLHLFRWKYDKEASSLGLDNYFYDSPSGNEWIAFGKDATTDGCTFKEGVGEKDKYSQAIYGYEELIKFIEENS